MVSDTPSAVKRRRGNTIIIQAAIVACTIAVSLVTPRFVTVGAVAENWVADLRLSLFNPPSRKQSDIVVLTITEETLATLSYRSPIDRGFLSDVLDTLEATEARAIGLDILFDQPTEQAKDARLIETIRSAPMPVVVGWTDIKTGLTEAQYKYQRKYLRQVRAGYSNLLKDPVDGTVRNMFPGRHEDGRQREPGYVGETGHIGVECRLAHEPFNRSETDQCRHHE